MAKVNTTIRLEEGLKKESMVVANELGISLNSVISLYLKNNFVRKRGIDFSLRDKGGFTKEASSDLLEIREDSKKGKNISKAYSDVSSLISDLKNDEVNYK